MNFQEYTALKEKPDGFTAHLIWDTFYLKGYPLWLMDTDKEISEDVYDNILGYGSLSDLYFERNENNIKDFVKNNYPDFQILAIIDFHLQDEIVGGEEELWEYEYEFVLFVDTKTEGNPVLFFNAQHVFKEIAPTFEAFYETLQPIKS